MNKLLLTLPLLAGCWPYLPGSFDDYADGVDTDPDSETDSESGTDTITPGDGPTLMGFVESTTYTGDYWNGDGTPSSVVIVLGFAPDTPLDRFVDGFGGRGRCTDTPTVVQDLVEVAEDHAGPDTLRLSMETGMTFSVPYDAPSKLWFSQSGDIDLELDDVGSIETRIDEGALSGPAFATPSAFVVGQPNIQGSSAPRIPYGDVFVSWSGVGSDDVIVSLAPFDATGDTIDPYYCVGNSSSGQGSLTVTASQFSELNDQSYIGVVVRVGRVHRSEFALSGAAGATAAIDAIQWKLGFAYFDPQ